MFFNITYSNSVVLSAFCVSLVVYKLYLLFYEKLYIRENPSIDLLEYDKYIDTVIEKSRKKEHIIGLAIEKELMDIYNSNDDIYKLQRQVKLLSKKYE